MSRRDASSEEDHYSTESGCLDCLALCLLKPLRGGYLLLGPYLRGDERDRPPADRAVRSIGRQDRLFGEHHYSTERGSVNYLPLCVLSRSAIATSFEASVCEETSSAIDQLGHSDK